MSATIEVIPTLDQLYSRTHGISKAAEELPCSTFTVREIAYIGGRFSDFMEPTVEGERALARYNNALRFAKRLEDSPLTGQPRYKLVLVSETDTSSEYWFEVAQ